MSQKYVFITGAPRSGTSALYYSMACHDFFAYPDLFLRKSYSELRSSCGILRKKIDEVHYFYHFYGERLTPERYHVDLELARSTKYESELRFLNLEPFLPQEGTFIWDEAYRALADGFLARRAHRFAEDIRAAYQFILERRPSKTVVLDKQPHFLQALPFIREHFPNSTLIHIIRDGRAVVNSIAYAFKYGRKKDGPSQWWGPRPLNFRETERLGVVERACHQWVDNVTRARQAKELFGSDYLELRYEDFVRDPGGTVRLLIGGCGLPTNRIKATFPASFDTSRNDTWRGNMTSDRPDGLWTQSSAIGKDEMRHFEVMNALLQELGYLKDLRS